MVKLSAQLKLFLSFSSLIWALGLSAQITIIVNEFPEDTPSNASFFVSGDFEGWTGGQEDYKLKKIEDTYQITLPKTESLLFKFTLGSWQSVECNTKGEAIDNRSYRFKKDKDTIYAKIEGWTHLFDSAKASTASGNVFIISEDFEIPQLNRKRRIWVYLPPNYNTANASFPVIYMHDGQNLFDSKTAYSVEWNVDETLNRLFRDKNMSFIVVGIDNGGDSRLDEYSPFKNEEYGGGEGDAYLEFIVNNLKPYIDKNYKTLKDKNNTAIIGSSMGGLISHYAALNYPEVFGKAAIFSPSFWFASTEIIEHAKTNAQKINSKLYYLAGAKEGDVKENEISSMVTEMNQMVELLKANGISPKNIQSKIVSDGEHNEKFWSEEFEDAILWLFPEKINTREFLSAKQNGSQLEIKVTDGTYKILFYSEDIVETTFIPTGETKNNPSHAVVMQPERITTTFSEFDDSLQLKSDGINVVIKKTPFKISYTYKENPIIAERNGYQKNDEFETIQMAVDTDEVLYGTGARALGMNRRGHRLRLYNRAHYGYETESKLMNYTMPIVMSSKKYMLHFDNAPIGYLDLDSRADNTITYETISGRKTYQFVAGETWYDIIDNYTKLTGKQPMLPRWALGNFSSRFGYRSQQETLKTISKFREENIPVDAIILDLYWFGKELKGAMGNFEFYRDSFPNPKQMIKDLASNNVETILITEPFVLTTSKRWQDAVEKNVLAKDSVGNPATYDFYFGNTGIIDIFNPNGKTWFKDIYKDLSNLGVNGFWGDLGEPEVHPSWVQHATGSADEVHNIYGHNWAKLVYEASLESKPNRRPFILMRAGYSGTQRYGMVPWSGDVNRTWGGLQSQPEIALQMGMQGLAYMHSDLGGFAGANLDDELYTRWLQYGVFQPIYRPHAQEDVPSEPIFRSEKAKRLASYAIAMRYRLLHYNYNLMAENHRYGKPLMRPLFFEEDNPDLYEYSETYLWGNDILVSPVLESGKKEQDVYFPKGSDWFDIETDELIEGGQTKIITLNEAFIPTYIRAGSFIPLATSVQSTKELNDNKFQLHYYHSYSLDEVEREFYFDDGVTVNPIEKGQYQVLEFEAEKEGNWLEIEFDAETGSNYTAKKKTIALILHNIKEEPKRVKIGRKNAKGSYNQKYKTLTLTVDWDTTKEKEIRIKLN